MQTIPFSAGVFDTLRMQHIADTQVPPSGRYTRSIYEHRFSEARHAERAHETREITRVAEHLVQFLQQAVQALAPIIGEKSVSALYKQSLYLNRSKHPWLSAAYGELPHTEVFTRLQSSVLRQTLRNAKTAVNDLVAMFHQLLQDLIGTSLAHRLLRYQIPSEAL